jgi:hypothetical protein
MDSRFNIPAPALVKLQSDVIVEKGCRLKVTVPQGDVEATAEADPLKQPPRKALQCSQGRPYRKPTQVGG